MVAAILFAIYRVFLGKKNRLKKFEPIFSDLTSYFI